MSPKNMMAVEIEDYKSVSNVGKMTDARAKRLEAEERRQDRFKVREEQYKRGNKNEPKSHHYIYIPPLPSVPSDSEPVVTYDWFATSILDGVLTELVKSDEERIGTAWYDNELRLLNEEYGPKIAAVKRHRQKVKFGADNDDQEQ